MTEEEKRRFVSGLPGSASVSDIASMWVVVSIAFRLSPSEFGTCIALCARALASGTYGEQVGVMPADKPEVKH